MLARIQNFTPAQQVVISLLIALVLTTASYAGAHYWGWLPELNTNNAWAGIPVLNQLPVVPLFALEAFAVFTSYSTTYLCVVQSRYNYPIGFVTTLAYALLFYQYGLVGSALTNIYLPIALIYGWFRWGPDGNTRPVHNVAVSWIPIYLAVTVATFLAVMLALHAVGQVNIAATWPTWNTQGNDFAFTLGGLSFSDSQVPLADVGILAMTILAQFLLDNKKLQTWFVWIAINCTAIHVYSQQGLALVTMQYVVFLANAFWGFLMWYRSMRLDQRIQLDVESALRIHQPRVEWHN